MFVAGFVIAVMGVALLTIGSRLGLAFTILGLVLIGLAVA